MPRLLPVSTQDAAPPTAELLAGVKQKLGVVPNLVATLAASPAAANAYVGFADALSHGGLPARLREQIALVVGEENQCDYCLAAHTMLGKSAGMTEQQTRDARSAHSDAPEELAALQLAQAIVRDRGLVDDRLIEAARDAGYNDGHIAEIVANVAINLFTNYFNHVAQTEVDFPPAPASAAG